MRVRIGALLTVAVASALLLAAGSAAGALPTPQPAFAYGTMVRVNWGQHDNILDVAHYDDIPPGRNIGVEVLLGPSFGHITVLSALNADGVPLVNYRPNSGFFSGSDTYRYRLVDLDTGETLDISVGTIVIIEDGDPTVTTTQYATYDSPNDYIGGSPGAAGDILTAVAGDGEVVLTWAPNSGTHVRIYDGLTMRSVSVTGTTATVTGLTNGSPYWFRMQNGSLGSAYAIGETGPVVPMATVPSPSASSSAPTPPSSSPSATSSPPTPPSSTPVRPVQVPSVPIPSATPLPTSSPTSTPQPSDTSTVAPDDSNFASPPAGESQPTNLPVWIWFLLGGIVVLVLAALVARGLMRARI